MSMFDKVITEEDLQSLLEDEDKFFEFTDKYPRTKVTTKDNGDFVLLHPDLYDELKAACVITESSESESESESDAE